MSNGHETERHRERRPARRAEHSLGRGPHEQAVLRAQVNRLVHALGPYGVLCREALEREARAGSWHEADFDRALRAAVDEGEIEELPLGFYALRRSDSSRGDDGDDTRNAA